jgi:serine/threonine protein phosphatase PrpC
MGDFSYLGMTCDPYVERNEIFEGDYLIIASDGIWDVIEDCDIGEYTTFENQTCAEIVREICSNAVRLGSEDNISCIVIKIA